jgi:hypothetical protein
MHNRFGAAQILALAASYKEMRIILPAWLWFSARGFTPLASNPKTTNQMSQLFSPCFRSVPTRLFWRKGTISAVS